MLSGTHYAQNYTSIIGWSLFPNIFYWCMTVTNNNSVSFPGYSVYMYSMLLYVKILNVLMVGSNIYTFDVISVCFSASTK